jgi:leader peptidase (prepilin peptidase)/N-methyltransferase
VLSEVPYWFVLGIAVSLGLAWGSFLNVVIHRLPRGESVAFPASRCARCGATLRGIDNVPVLSWLFLRGRARCCGAPISPRYPVVEAIGGLTGYAICEKIFVEFGPDGLWYTYLAVFALYLALCLGLVALVFIDLEYMILPDSITLGLAALGLSTFWFRSMHWTESFGGAAFGFVIVWLPFHVIYKKLRGHPGMGLGDAKLLLLAGAWFGVGGALFALMAGAVQGTLVAIVILLVKGRIEEPDAVRREREEAKAHLDSLEGEERAAFERELAKDPLANAPEEGLGKARLPFGPFLALATLEYFFVGEAVLQGYLRFLGGGT